MLLNISMCRIIPLKRELSGENVSNVIVKTWDSLSKASSELKSIAEKPRRDFSQGNKKRIYTLGKLFNGFSGDTAW